MRLLRYFFQVTLIIVGVLMLMVLRDIINPPREINVVIEPAWVVYPEDDIRHRDNSAYVVEVAFNLGIDPSEVTQEQFNERYSNPLN